MVSTLPQKLSFWVLLTVYIIFLKFTVFKVPKYDINELIFQYAMSNYWFIIASIRLKMMGEPGEEMEEGKEQIEETGWCNYYCFLL